MHPVLRHPRYWQLATGKVRVTGVLAAVALGVYLLFAAGATWQVEWMLLPVFADANLGLFLALGVIGVCGLIAFLYGRIATNQFDPIEDELRRTAWDSEPIGRSTRTDSAVAGRHG